MDNVQQTAPVIPAGTEPTVFGGAVYEQGKGQAAPTPGEQKVNPASIENALQAVLQETPTVIDAGHQDSQSTGISFQQLAEKKGFKSPDDLAKAYENLEFQNSRTANTLQEVIKVRQDSFQQQEQEFEQPKVESQEDALKVVERVVKKMTRPLEDRIELQNLLLQHPDASKYASDMAGEVKRNPGISWDAAYRLAKFNELERQSKEKGKQEAYQTIQQKQELNTGSGRSGSQPVQQNSLGQLNALIADRKVPWQEVQRLVKETLRP